MSIQFDHDVITETELDPGDGVAEDGAPEWEELDISIVESGPWADRLIRMTDDGCGQTCESACSTTCK